MFSYLLCGRYNQTNGMTQIPDDICLKFPSCYQGHRDLYSNTCMPSRIHRGIMSIKRAIVKTFSRSSQNQGSFEISKGQIINVDPQVWDHMKHVTDDVDIASLSVDRKRVFRETSSGMDMARRSCTQTCELRRHEMYKHLLALQECFGKSITASQRKQTKTAPLDENDIINCIEGSTAHQESGRPTNHSWNRTCTHCQRFPFDLAHSLSKWACGVRFGEGFS
jgi:hypothetical protein